MNTTQPPGGVNLDPHDDPRVLAAAREYLAELEAGITPDPQVYIQRHPDLGDVIAECLEGVELAHAMGRPKQRTSNSTLGHPVRIAPEASIEFRAEPLGDFQILKEIGRGGMGVVYEAMQLSLGRRVALKVLPFAAAMDAKQLTRFRTESHAAAQLHHTNIVPVYAVGCERGTHFYAMQFIDGKPLDEYIRELSATPETTSQASGIEAHRETAQPSRTQRSTSERELFRTSARIGAQVAEALEYAHESGVIHRDIKPANLLLDVRGNVWVADFGLAQMTQEASGMTRTGDIFGTLRYMSPEQAAGRRTEVDHRSDVYSLGATLYELLTQQPIFPGTDRQKLLQQILHDDPASLRSANPKIPGELETIVLKATAKAVQDRYATAGDLAADLRRFLDDRPILARRPTLRDRVRKWMRRHPAYVRAAVVLLAMSLVGAGVGLAVVMNEKAKTELAYQSAQKRAAEAEERFQLARRSADEMIRIADEELTNDPQQQALRRKLLESALNYYQELIDLRKDDVDAVMHGAWRHRLVGVPTVQEDLKLTPEQRTQVREMNDKMFDWKPDSYRRLKDLSQQERNEQLVTEVRAHEELLQKLLLDGQRKRLQQIALQVQGPRVFQDADVMAALKLTPAQRERMKQLEAKHGGPPGGSPPSGGPIAEGPPGTRGGPPFPKGLFPKEKGPPPGGPGDKFDKGDKGFKGGRGGPPPEDYSKNTQQMMTRMLEVLTPEQRQTWTDMIGEPFAGLTRMPY
jgi:eukaryotic-like serine/threonine-protein kinase